MGTARSGRQGLGGAPGGGSHSLEPWEEDWLSHKSTLFSARGNVATSSREGGKPGEVTGTSCFAGKGRDILLRYWAAWSPRKTTSSPGDLSRVCIGLQKMPLRTLQEQGQPLGRASYQLWIGTEEWKVVAEVLSAASRSLGLLELGVVAYTCDPSTGVTDTGCLRVRGQPGLRIKT